MSPDNFSIQIAGSVFSCDGSSICDNVHPMVGWLVRCNEFQEVHKANISRSLEAMSVKKFRKPIYNIVTS
jgi:hypothetical protein